MGAKNAKAAYRLYAGKVPPTSLTVLVYMALISKDADAEPWWSEGHQALAVNALGRAEAADEKAQRANEGAVERAIAPLYRAGAITCTRRASGHGDLAIGVRYRLWLSSPATSASHGNRGKQQPSTSTSLPTVSVTASHGFRGTKEEERNIHIDQDHDDLFEEFWGAYPRKTGKAEAERAWNVVVAHSASLNLVKREPKGDPADRTDLILIADCARQYAKDIDGIEPRFVQGAARWLNEENWLDHLPCVKVELRCLSRTG